VTQFFPGTGADDTNPEQNGESMGLDGDGNYGPLGLLDLSVAKSLRFLPGLMPQENPHK
jgi:hypothetical protein